MRSRHVRWFALLAAVLVWSDRACAIWDKYSPFVPDKAPPRFRHVVLKMARHGYDLGETLFFEFFRPRETAASLRIDWLDGGNRVSVPSRGGQPAFSAPIEGSPVCDAEVSTADLNGDAIPDYIVVTHSGGNGLAAQVTTITFLLSSGKGYVAREVLSFDAAPIDLVDLNGDGRPEFVHCMSVYGGQGKDGRSHNYWVYNLLGFSGANLISANSASSEFPKWIAYTYAPNHWDSTQLSAEQRRRQWLAAWKGQAGLSTTNLFPDLETVALEQGRSIARN